MHQLSFSKSGKLFLSEKTTKKLENVTIFNRNSKNMPLGKLKNPSIALHRITMMEYLLKPEQLLLLFHKQLAKEPISSRNGKLIQETTNNC